jgi:two-component system, OmpR family, sensor kinase
MHPAPPATGPGEPPAAPPDGPAGSRFDAPRFAIPFEPIASGLIASLVSAALIAWYIAKPVRTLKSAIGIGPKAA